MHTRDGIKPRTMQAKFSIKSRKEDQTAATHTPRSFLSDEAHAKTALINERIFTRDTEYSSLRLICHWAYLNDLSG